MQRLILAFFMALLLTACAPMDHHGSLDDLELFPVDFMDENAQALLTLVDHRSERLPSGHVNVMLQCMNEDAKKKKIWIDWKVVFFDSRNIKVEHSEWHTEYLALNERKTLQMSSLRRDIQSFRFLIRTTGR